MIEILLVLGALLLGIVAGGVGGYRIGTTAGANFVFDRAIDTAYSLIIAASKASDADTCPCRLCEHIQNVQSRREPPVSPSNFFST